MPKSGKTLASGNSTANQPAGRAQAVMAAQQADKAQLNVKYASDMVDNLREDFEGDVNGEQTDIESRAYARLAVAMTELAVMRSDLNLAEQALAAEDYDRAIALYGRVSIMPTIRTIDFTKSIAGDSWTTMNEANRVQAVKAVASATTFAREAQRLASAAKYWKTRE